MHAAHTNMLAKHQRIWSMKKTAGDALIASQTGSWANNCKIIP